MTPVSHFGALATLRHAISYIMDEMPALFGPEDDLVSESDF